MKHLLAAEGIFKEACELEERGHNLGEPYTALVQVGDRVFEVGRVQLGSDTGVHLKSRVGIPQEEILAELEDGQYDLVMLGAHRIPGCPWSEIENGPLYVAQRARHPVMVMGRKFEKGQPLLVCIGDKDPPEFTLGLVNIIATGMQCPIDLLRVLEKPKSGFEFSPKVSSMKKTWSEGALRVSQRVMTGDPLTVILEMASRYGLIVCPLGEKHKKGRLGKVVKGVLCSQFNLLIVR
jgi:hypothetical protein